MTENNYGEFVTADVYEPSTKEQKQTSSTSKNKDKVAKDLEKLSKLSKDVYKHFNEIMDCCHCKKSVSCSRVSMSYIENYARSVYFNVERPDCDLHCPYDIPSKIEEHITSILTEKITTYNCDQPNQLYKVLSHLQYVRIKEKYELNNIPGITETECTVMLKNGIYDPIDLCTVDTKHLMDICKINEERATELIKSARVVCTADILISELPAEEKKNLYFIRTSV